VELIGLKVLLTSITNLNPTSPTYKLRAIHRLPFVETKMNLPTSQHQTLLPPSAPCAIMTLPNELLRESLSYLIPIGVWGLVDDATRRNFFSLRSVCRTFRAVIDGLDVWCDPEFEYVDLMPYHFKDSQQEREALQAKFLHLLLQNPVLVESIGRRREWRFTSLTSFRTIREHIPSFSSNTTSVTFEGAISSGTHNGWDGITIPLGVRALVDCTQLTFLKIWGISRDHDDHIDLDLITTTCPNLRQITLQNILRYTGTLANMRYLEHVYICFEQYSVHTEHLPRDNRILPLTYGAQTICKLWLHYEERFLCTLGTHALRDPFPNLTSLSLHPFTHDLCNYISTSNIRLVQLRTTVVDNMDTPDLWTIANLFSSPSLATLKELRLVFQFEEDQHSQYELIFQSICTRLLHLEELVLGLSFDTAWCPQLTNLQYLKFLHWYIPETGCRDSLRVIPQIGNPGVEGIAWNGSLKLRFENYIRNRGWGRSGPRPGVEVWLLTSNDFGNLCDMRAAPTIYDI
jgi:hypothetical protein